MGVPVADRWFDLQPLDDGVTLFTEPHVIPLMRCNIWHVRGRDRDLFIDTGMGVASLVGAAENLLDKPVTAVATHGHEDHIGSHYEFADVLAHPAEAESLERGTLQSLDPIKAWGLEELQGLERAGYDTSPPYFVSALPAGVALETFTQTPARVTGLIEDGDVLDLGDRQLEVLHLPGHSPGSIGLWEATTCTLFSGDAAYDGPLLDELHDSDIEQYCRTMERLLTLPVRVVHGGHDASFDGAVLRRIARSYLEHRSPT